MKRRTKFTSYNLIGSCQKVKSKKALARQYLWVRSFHDRDSWSFINWRYRVVQGLLDFLGGHPDVLYQRGVLKVHRWGALTRFPCDNSPESFPESSEPITSRKKEPKISLQERLERAEKRIAYSERCGAKGSVVVLEHKETLERFVSYLPVHCHSVFCPRCSSEWSREVRSRIMSAFENVDEVHFITLTIQNRECRSFEETYQAIDDIMSFLSKLYNLKITDRFLSRLEGAFVEECQAYFENAKKKVGRKEARKSVVNQTKYFRAFLPVLRSFKGYKLGQVLNAVWRLEVKSRIVGDALVLHPHFHGLTTAPAPKLFWQAVWSMVVGGSVVTDARVVRGKEAVGSYVSEYESKPEEPPVGKGILPFDVARLWIEASLFNRQRLRVWGFSVVSTEIPEEMKPYKATFVYYLAVYLNLERPLPDKFSCWLRCKNEGVDRIFLTRGSVRDFRFSSEMYYEVFLYYDIHRGFVLEGIPDSALPCSSGSGFVCGVDLDFDCE